MFQETSNAKTFLNNFFLKEKKPTFELNLIAMTSKNVILSVIRKCKPQLASFGVSRIGLFGSYVRNEQQPQSDIDFLVDFEPEKETFDNFMNLYNYLEELFVNEKVEVVTVNGLSPYIGKYILKEVDYA